MLDNALIEMIINILTAGASGAGIPGILIKQSNQPTMQGSNSAPTLYLYKIGPDRRVGSVYRQDVYNSGTGAMDHIETQQYESMFQLSGIATQNPQTPDAYTASDIANLAAYIMQSSATITTLEASGVGIYRISDVRNPYAKDDRYEFEATASFDFILTHKQVITSSMPIINTAEFQILEV